MSNVTVKIVGSVIPTENEDDDNIFYVLVDTWWKIAVWATLAALAALILCYVSKCCFLVWDCCADPYWGCCPCMRTEKCKNCCLLRRKRKESSSSKPSDYYKREIDEEDEEVVVDCDERIRFLSTPSTMDGGGPVRKIVVSGSAEALPQIYDGYYFNILHFFGLGKSRGHYVLDSGLPSTEHSSEDTDHHDQVLPKNECELISIQKRNSQYYPQSRYQRSSEETLPKRPIIDTSEFLERCDSVATTRSSSYNEDAGSLLNHGSVHFIMFGKETIL